MGGVFDRGVETKSIAKREDPIRLSGVLHAQGPELPPLATRDVRISGHSFAVVLLALGGAVILANVAMSAGQRGDLGTIRLLPWMLVVVLLLSFVLLVSVMSRSGRKRSLVSSGDRLMVFRAGKIAGTAEGELDLTGGTLRFSCAEFSFEIGVESIDRVSVSQNRVVIRLMRLKRFPLHLVHLIPAAGSVAAAEALRARLSMGVTRRIAEPVRPPLFFDGRRFTASARIKLAAIGGASGLVLGLFSMRFAGANTSTSPSVTVAYIALGSMALLTLMTLDGVVARLERESFYRRHRS